MMINDRDRIAQDLEEIIARAIDEICARDRRIAKLEQALREIVEGDAGYHEAQFLARKALGE